MDGGVVMHEQANAVLTLTDATFEAEVIRSPLPVLVEFTVPGCAPCVAIGHLLSELAVEYAGRLRFAKLNVAEEAAVPARYGVQSAPTLIFFVEGQPAERVLGMTPKELIERKLDAPKPMPTAS